MAIDATGESTEPDQQTENQQTENQRAQEWTDKTQRRIMAVLAIMVAIASIVAASAGFAVASQVRRITQLQEKIHTGDIGQSAALADRGPKNSHVALSNESGDQRIDIAVTPSRVSYVTGGKLDRLDEDRSYQLWSVSSGTRVSVGLVPRNSDGLAATAFVLPKGAEMLELTIEPATGSAQPSSPAVAKGIVALSKVIAQ